MKSHFGPVAARRSVRATLLAGAWLLAAGAAQAAAPEPVVQAQVLEDDNVRIEELRVRGQNQRLRVQPKTPGVAAYEIQPEEPMRESGPGRGSAGQRVWRLLSF